LGKKRKTTVFGVKFDLPEDLVDDIAYPQLERAHKGMLIALQRNGFSALRGDIYYDHGRLSCSLKCEFRTSLPWNDTMAHLSTQRGTPTNSKRNTSTTLTCCQDHT